MKISDVFKSGKKALVCYLPVGYPKLNSTTKLVPLLADNGCDIVELGIPFSDPIGDGSVIQDASYRALQNGVTLDYCLKTAATLTATVKIPLLFMSYYNPILHYGISNFATASARVGISGLIVPDIPPEEAGNLSAAYIERGLDLIYLIAPNSTEERIKLAAQQSRGFIYLISTSGVTGVRQNLSHNLSELIERINRYAKKPICVGFGIGSTTQAAEVSHLADGVVIGSHLIKLINDDESYGSLASFIREVKATI